MSGQSRLASLISAIGADVKSLSSQIAALQNGSNTAQLDLPSYAPSGLQNNYDPLMNVYNLKGSNTKKTHAGISQALNGGKMNILAVGDSAFVGYNGTDVKEGRCIPRMVGKMFAQGLGVPQAGSGIVMPAAASGMIPIDHFVTTGSVAAGTGTLTMYAGSTCMFTSEQAGTSADVFYADQSAAFTVSIDGGAPVTVTPTGTPTIKRWTSAALADTLHTIKVTAPTNYVFLDGMAVQRASGVALHNISWGGARAALGGPTVAWLDTSQAANIQVHRKGAFDTMGVTPDLVVWSLGGNDAASGTTNSQFAASFATLKNWWPSSDHMLLTGPGLSTVPQATWDSFVSSLYSLADSLDMPLLDLRDRCGYATEAGALGYIGADGFHPNDGAMIDWARLIVDSYAKSGTYPLTKWVQLTQAQYDALPIKDSATMYVIVG